jgi:hypothetical protein
MRLKLIKGLHLTAREKQVIAYAIANECDAAHSSKIHADNVQPLGDGRYSARVWHWETSDTGRRFQRFQSVEVMKV